jgi:hypothetical protein
VFGGRDGVDPMRLALAQFIMLIAAGATFSSDAVASARDDAAQAAIRHFRRGELREALSLMDPRALPGNPDAVAQQIYGILRSTGTSPVVTQIFWRGFRSMKQDLQKDQLAYHVVGDEAAALVFVTAETVGGRTTLTAFHCEAAPRNLTDRYPLTMRGVSIANYLFLLTQAAVASTMLAAGVLWFRRSGRRRWLWLAAILLGVGKVGLYWLPGPFSWSHLRLDVFSVSFLGVGIVKFPLYDPWRLTISAPVGAIAFLVTSLRSAPSSAVAAAEQRDEPEARAGAG